MAPKSVTFRRHDHLVSVLFGDLLSHSYNITFSMFLYLVLCTFLAFEADSKQIFTNHFLFFATQVVNFTTVLQVKGYARYTLFF